MKDEGRCGSAVKFSLNYKKHRPSFPKSETEGTFEIEPVSVPNSTTA